MKQFPPSVLIVDDDPEIRVGLRYYLESKGFQILVAGNGLEAMETLRKGSIKPQVIVLDLRMPEEGGLSFLHRLKQEKSPPKVIVVTALGGDAIQQAVGNFQIEKMIEKPVALPVVEQAIREVLEKNVS